MVSEHQMEHEQYYPRPGSVEHDADEIWVRACRPDHRDSSSAAPGLWRRGSTSTTVIISIGTVSNMSYQSLQLLCQEAHIEVPRVPRLIFEVFSSHTQAHDSCFTHPTTHNPDTRGEIAAGILPAECPCDLDSWTLAPSNMAYSISIAPHAAERVFRREQTPIQ